MEEANRELFRKVEDLFSCYVGKISYSETDSRFYPYEISITHDNRLIKHRTDGSVWADRYVKCTVAVEHDNEDGYGVRAEESTLSVLGGMSCGQCTLDEALKLAKEQLKKYNFTLKHDEQLRLF